MKHIIKVLLIEDDEDDVVLTKGYLQEIENHHFDVTWEANPNEVRKRIQEGEYDLFLIDYRLGGENGLELVKFIRENNIFTPAIILTGQEDLKVDMDASVSGASDYLIKNELTTAMLERSIRYSMCHAMALKEADEKEKKYRSLFERSIDSIFLATSKFELMDVNEAFADFFGYSKMEASELSLVNFFEKQEDYDYFIDTLREDQQIKDYEVSLITKGGEIRVCLVNCIFIEDVEADFCCYQGIVHDLTLRKKAEHDMLVAERLSLTGRIARTLAHEVRNPLTNLTLALDQLRAECSGKHESVHLFLDIIDRNINRIEQLVEEMLNSSNSKELDKVPAQLSEVIEETISLAKDRISLNRIKVKNNVKKDLPRIHLDRKNIQIAFLNIIINAIEAMTPGEGILVIDARLPENELVVRITDNGSGIPKEHLTKLFEPYFTSKENGMGLGLTATKTIISNHGAKLEVTSTPGEGTTFSITFPLNS